MDPFSDACGVMGSVPSSHGSCADGAWALVSPIDSTFEVGGLDAHAFSTGGRPFRLPSDEAGAWPGRTPCSEHVFAEVNDMRDDEPEWELEPDEYKSGEYKYVVDRTCCGAE